MFLLEVEWNMIHDYNAFYLSKLPFYLVVWNWFSS